MLNLSRFISVAACSMLFAHTALAETIVAPEAMKWAAAKDFCSSKGASMLEAEALKARFMAGEFPRKEKRDSFWSSSEFPTPRGKPDAHETVNGAGFVTSVKDVYKSYVICFK